MDAVLLLSSILFFCLFAPSFHYPLFYRTVSESFSFFSISFLLFQPSCSCPSLPAFLSLFLYLSIYRTLSLNVCMYVCVNICKYLSVHPSVLSHTNLASYPSIYLSYLFVCRFVRPSVHPSIYLFVSVSVRPSVYMSICLF